jgi:hypothetical protein
VPLSPIVINDSPGNPGYFIWQKGERMRKTGMNLMSALAGESQATRKYLAFAAQADKEGYPQDDSS